MILQPSNCEKLREMVKNVHAVPPSHAARAARLPRAASHARGLFTTIFLYYVHNALKGAHDAQEGTVCEHPRQA